MTETIMTIDKSLSPTLRMRGYLQSVATGPEMSKPISRAESRDAMAMILAGEVDAVQAGIYLIAMRMKRETDDENLGALDALLAAVTRREVACETLVDIADPFNGYARGVPATPFLPAVLAACGVNAYSHGLRAVGPKYGVTHHQVFAASGVPVDATVDAAADAITNPDIGWAYLDQSRYLPALHDLVGLRAQMVKRACLTTLEVLLGPLRAGGTTRLMTGYVHKAYPPVYAALARAAGYDGAMIVRGVEGGCIPSLSQPAKFFAYINDSADEEIRVTPDAVGVNQTARTIPIPPQHINDTPLVTANESEAELSAPIDTQAVAEYCAQLGVAALSGDDDDACAMLRDSLVYGGAIALLHCGRATTLGDAAKQVRAAIDSGEAGARFAAARR